MEIHEKAMIPSPPPSDNLSFWSRPFGRFPGPVYPLVILVFLIIIVTGCLHVQDRGPAAVPAPAISKSNGSDMLAVTGALAYPGTPSTPGEIPIATTSPRSLPCLISGNISAGSGSAPGCLTLTFVDVEQGDAILIRSPSNRTMLIDAGKPEHSGDVVAALHQQGVTSLDVLVASHPHGDHIGGMPAVIAAFPVQQFFRGPVSCSSSPCRLLEAALEKEEVPVQIVRKGDSIPFDKEVSVTVLSPPEALFDEVNDNSLILRLVYGNTTFLLTGDAGKEAEREMIAVRAPLKADLLKIGHHGLSSSTTAQFVTLVKPEISIVSLEKSTNPTHPDPAVIRRLMESGSVVYRTDDDGSITVLSNGSALAVVSRANLAASLFPVHASALS